MMRIAILFVTGCSLMYEPDVGPLQPLMPDAHMSASGDGGPAPVGGPCGDSDPTVTTSFSTHVRPLLSRAVGGCLFCHGATSTSGLSVGSYQTLRRGGQNSGTNIVIAGRPCDSILVQKLSVAPPFGSRMPYNGPPYFTAAELTIVKDWIAEGALNN